MKPSPKYTKAKILITGDELAELQKYTYQMADAFGLDHRIDNYQGSRQISLHSWDFDCLFAILEDVLNDHREYPNKSSRDYLALSSLKDRLVAVYKEAFQHRDA